METKIYLASFFAPGTKVYTGRDKGEEIRESICLDKIFGVNTNITFVIPEGIYSINPSFFEALFVNVINKYNKKAFDERVNFISEGDYNYIKPLSEAIGRILRENGLI